jgi:hypothetical protein
MMNQFGRVTVLVLVLSGSVLMGMGASHPQNRPGAAQPGLPGVGGGLYGPGAEGGPIDPSTGLPAGLPIPETWQEKAPKDISFKNLPCGEVVRLLREYFPKMNFIVDPELDGETVQIEQLRNVTLEDILSALNLASRGAIRATPVKDNIVSLQRGGVRMRPEKMCRPFGLSRYLSGKGDAGINEAMKDLQDALQTCWKMMSEANGSGGNAGEPLMNLHKGTMLLLVVGTPEQLDVVSQVVGQLQPSMPAFPGGGNQPQGAGQGMMPPHQAGPTPAPGFGAPGGPGPEAGRGQGPGPNPGKPGDSTNKPRPGR